MQGGSQYTALCAFQQIFGPDIFRTDIQRDKAAVYHEARFNFMTEERIWHSRDHDQQTLPGGRQHEIVLSAREFYREIMSRPLPADLNAANSPSSTPATPDLFMDFVPLFYREERRTSAFLSRQPWLNSIKLCGQIVRFASVLKATQ